MLAPMNSPIWPPMSPAGERGVRRQGDQEAQDTIGVVGISGTGAGQARSQRDWQPL
jgi:hypothetical protein